MDFEKNIQHILESIEGMLVLDMDANIVYMADHLAREVGYDTGRMAVGRSIKEVIPTNTAYKVIETGKKKIGEVYFVQGKTIVSNAIPIMSGDEMLGVLEYDVFENAHMLQNFLDKIEELSEELRYYKQEVRRIRGAKYSIDNIVGISPEIEKLREQIFNSSRSTSMVLIQGETGSGKELVAHSIHRLSPRGLGSFVKVNCSAIPPELFESELFGYDEGTFTGALKGGKKGKIEIAQGGTLFLDEINQMPLVAQPKLLRFLQEKEIHRIGGEFPIPVDVRIIVASNQSLRNLVQENKFREDLYFRLNVLQIDIPPLRERKVDIPYISEHIINELNETFQMTHPVKKINADVLKVLDGYNWPGNVRELHNVLERAMNNIPFMRKTLELQDVGFLSGEIMRSKMSASIIGQTDFTLKNVKAVAEKMAIEHVLEVCGGNKSKAAEILGISRQMFHRKLSKM